MRPAGKDGGKDNREEQRRQQDEERRAARIRAGAALFRSASEPTPSNAASTTPILHRQAPATSSPKDQGTAVSEGKRTTGASHSPQQSQTQRLKNASSDTTVTQRLSQIQNTNAGAQPKAPPSSPKLSPKPPGTHSLADIPEFSLSDSHTNLPSPVSYLSPSLSPTPRTATPVQRQCTPADFKTARNHFFARIAHANRPDVQPLFASGRPIQLTKKDIEKLTGGSPELLYRYIPLHRIGKPGSLISYADFQRWYDAGIIINSGALEVEAIIGNDMNFDLRHFHAIVILKDATRPLTDDNIARCLLIRTQCDAVLISSRAEIKSMAVENKQVPVHLDLTVTPNTYRALPGKISIYDTRTARPGIDEHSLLLNCGDRGFISRRAEISWYDFVLHGKLQISKLFPPECEANEPHFMEILYALLLNCIRPVEFIQRHIDLSSSFAAVQDNLKSTYLASIQKHFDPHLFNADILSHFPEFIFYFKHQCQQLDLDREIEKGQCDLGDIFLLLINEGISLGFQQELIFKLIKQRINDMQAKLSLCFNPSSTTNESTLLMEALSHVVCPAEFTLARIATESKCSEPALLQGMTEIYSAQIYILRDKIICGFNSFRAALKTDGLQNAIASLKKPAEIKEGDAKELIQKRIEKITQNINQDVLSLALQQLLTPHLFHFTQAQRVSHSVSQPETRETIHRFFIKEIVSLEEIIFNLPEFKHYLIEQFQLYEQGHQGVIPEILQHLLEKAADLDISNEQCIQELDARLASIRFYITDQLQMQTEQTAAPAVPAEGKATLAASTSNPQPEVTPTTPMKKP